MQFSGLDESSRLESCQIQVLLAQTNTWKGCLNKNVNEWNFKARCNAVSAKKTWLGSGQQEKLWEVMSSEMCNVMNSKTFTYRLFSSFPHATELRPYFGGGQDEWGWEWNEMHKVAKSVWSDHTDVTCEVIHTSQKDDGSNDDDYNSCSHDDHGGALYNDHGDARSTLDYKQHFAKVAQYRDFGLSSCPSSTCLWMNLRQIVHFAHTKEV